MVNSEIYAVTTEDDVRVAALLLHRFNVEFDDPVPPIEALTQRTGEIIAAGDVVLLAGRDAVGVAVLRFRLALWSSGLECYLAELYVVPDHRRQGCGLALMTEAMRIARDRGADTMDLGTSESDVAAIALYERLGFTNREGAPEGPRMLYYERPLT